MTGLGIAYFYGCALLAVLGALGVVFSKNPIRSAMGLLLLILAVAGLFLSLHAQFLAAVQLIVYAGAVVILFLFVIMLLGPTAVTSGDNAGLWSRAFGGGLFAFTGLAAIVAVWHAGAGGRVPGPLGAPDSSFGGIGAFGDILFSDSLVPFELSSALLMVAVVGAIAVARGRQGERTLSKSELDETRTVTLGADTAGHSGVFSHESAGAQSLPTPSTRTSSEEPAR
jgi:NADH-quinone oxidoreductase subunit J